MEAVFLQTYLAAYLWPWLTYGPGLLMALAYLWLWLTYGSGLLMALAYSRSFLRAIAPPVSEIRVRCSFVLWRRLTEHGISRVKPTRRGCRGGRRKLRTLTQQQTLQIDSSGDNLLSPDNLLRQEELSLTNAQVNYHNELIEALNIQIDTSESGT